MPGLQACGRAWNIGSDDFVFPGIAELFVRLAWLIGIIIAFNIHKVNSCNAHVIQIYYIGILVILSCHIVLNLILTICSGRGSVLYTKPRASVPMCLYFKMVLFIPDFGWTIMGTYWAFGFDSEVKACEWYIIWTVRGAVVAGWVILLGLIIAILVFFDPLGTRSHPSEHEMSANRTNDRWSRRCRWACCCVACDEQSENALQEASTLFSHLFSMNGIDLLVPTDVAAGLVMVSRKQSRDESSREKCVDCGSAPATPTPGPSHSSGLEAGGAAASRTVSAEEQPPQDTASASVTAADVHWAASSTQENGLDPGVKQPVAKQPVTNEEALLVDLTDSNQLGTSHGGLTNSTVQSLDYTTANEMISSEEVESSRTIQQPMISSEEVESSRTQSQNQTVIEDQRLEWDSFPKPKHWMTVPNAAYYMRFALGVYGWPLYMYSHIFSGLCQLLGMCRCCRCCLLQPDVDDDNCCECNMAALKKTTGLEKEDVIHASFINQIYTSPFFVALDHKNKCIVISIRGSMSFKDALTDMVVTSEEYEFEEFGRHKVHRGIARTAENIRDKLEQRGILDMAFRKCPDYCLMLVGHSLGAGVAALLALILEPKYKTKVSCFAYSPPGWLVSGSLLKHTNDLICSVVTGADLVPRIGLYTFELLKVDILRALQQTHMPKHQILVKGCWTWLCPASTEDEDEEGQLIDQSSPSCSSYTVPTNGQLTDDADHQIQATVEETVQLSLQAAEQCDKLYLPGQVLYFKLTDKDSRCCGKQVYKPMWARPEQFDEIIVTGSMVGDHFPDNVLRVLEETAEKGLYPTYYLIKKQKLDTQSHF